MSGVPKEVPQRAGRALAAVWLGWVLGPAVLTLAREHTSAGLAALAFTVALIVLPWAARLRRTAWAPCFALTLSASVLWASLAMTGQPPTLASALAVFRTTSKESADLARVLWPQALAGLAILTLVMKGQQAAQQYLRSLKPASMRQSMPLLALLLAPLLVSGTEDRYPLVMVTLSARVHEFQAAQSSVVAEDPFFVRREAGRGLETVVFVIGESSQATHWQVLGYGRPTTPNLLRRQEAGELLMWPRHMSTASATITAVPALLNPFEQVQVSRGALRRRSLVTVLERAGFNTAWLSTQGPQPASTEARSAHFEGSVDVFKTDTGFDDRLVPALQAWLSSTPAQPRAAFLHTCGSHFPFEGRYPPAFLRWNDFEGKRFPASQTVGNYDNSVLFTDHVLEQLLVQLQGQGEPALVVFVSDHGETLMDGVMRDQAPVDARVLHVPMFVWANQAWRTRHAERWHTLRDVLSRRPATSHLDVVPSLTGLLGIEYEGRPSRRDLLSKGYHSPSSVPALASDYRTVIEVEPAR